MGDLGFCIVETTVFLVADRFRLSFDNFMLEMFYSLTEIFNTFSAPCLAAFRKENKAALGNFSVCSVVLCLQGGERKGVLGQRRASRGTQGLDVTSFTALFELMMRPDFVGLGR